MLHKFSFYLWWYRRSFGGDNDFLQPLQPFFESIILLCEDLSDLFCHSSGPWSPQILRAYREPATVFEQVYKLDNVVCLARE